MAHILPLLAALALVLLNGFFVAAEFALVKVRRTRIRELAESGEGGWRARLAAHLVSRLDAYLSATQLGITLASIALGWIGEPAVAHLIEAPLRRTGIASETTIEWLSFGVAFAIIAFFHIVLGELAPKSLAIRKAERTALWVSAPLLAFYYALYPFIVVLNGAANALLRLIGIAPAGVHEEAHSGEEVQMIVAASHAHGMLSPTASRIIDRTLGFSERRAGDLMVPRTEVVWIEEGASIDALRVVVGTNPYSHFPVCRGRGGLDALVGVVHIKDLIAHGLLSGRDFQISAVVQEPLFVPETTPALKVLDLLQSSRMHIAFVVNEYGGVEGIVTVNDLVRALVGETPRRGDARPPTVVRRKDGTWLVDGAMPLHEVVGILGLSPNAAEHVSGMKTIAGVVLTSLGHVPRVGEACSWEGHRLQVEEMDGARIERVLVEKER